MRHAAPARASVPRALAALVLGALVVGAAACVSPGAFVCASNEACVQAGAQGRCEPTGYCSFPDDGCPGGHRYGAHAGPHSGMCVDGTPTDGTPPDGTPPDGASCGGAGEPCCASATCGQGLGCLPDEDVCGCVLQLSAGGGHACVIAPDRSLWCWGLNSTGQLGDGTTTDRLQPTLVPGLAGVARVSAGNAHTCAVTTTGQVLCWGLNDHGQLGDGTTINRSAPVGVLEGMVEVAAGETSTCATNGEAVLCWGDNEGGQVGDGQLPTDAPLPKQVFASPVVGLDVSYHVCVAHAGGALACWGYGNLGQIGDGNIANRPSPVSLDAYIGGVADVTTGFAHTCALHTDGAVACWGHNGVAQVGSPNPQETIPYLVTPGPMLDVTGGGTHTCALRPDGVPVCWGDNSVGQLGRGTIGSPSTSLEPVTGVGGVVDLSAGYAYTCGLRVDGASCWGANTSGQLGTGDRLDSTAPRAVSLPFCPLP